MLMGFTDAQLDRINSAAMLLPVNQRDHFVRSIAKRLADLPNPNASDLRKAILFILSAKGISATPSLIWEMRKQA
jgi:hypothetical protein